MTMMMRGGAPAAAEESSESADEATEAFLSGGVEGGEEVVEGAAEAAVESLGWRCLNCCANVPGLGRVFNPKVFTLLFEGLGAFTSGRGLEYFKGQ